MKGEKAGTKGEHVDKEIDGVYFDDVSEEELKSLLVM